MINFTHSRKKNCSKCDGKGGSSVANCGPCKGKGMIEKMMMLGPGMY